MVVRLRPAMERSTVVTRSESPAAQQSVGQSAAAVRAADGRVVEVNRQYGRQMTSLNFKIDKVSGKNDSNPVVYNNSVKRQVAAAVALGRNAIVMVYG